MLLLEFLTEILSQTRKVIIFTSIYFEKDKIEDLFLDNSTGEFLVAEGKSDYIDKLLQSFNPSEVLFESNKRKEFEKLFGDRFFTHTLDDWIYTTDYSNELLTNQFNTSSLKRFWYRKNGIVLYQATILHYLKETHHHLTQHISTIE